MDPDPTLPWREQDDVFVPYEEDAMLSSAFGFKVRISRQSPSDPTAYERWIPRLRNALGPMEKLEEDECLDGGSQKAGNIMVSMKCNCKWSRRPSKPFPWIQYTLSMRMRSGPGERAKIIFLYGTYSYKRVDFGCRLIIWDSNFIGGILIRRVYYIPFERSVTV